MKARLFAWCDSPTAATGFGRSAQHVLHALHESGGYDIVQLAVNLDLSDIRRIPWLVYAPTDRANDPYGIQDIGRILQTEHLDMMWTTFDPEVPWKYILPGTQPQVAALDAIAALRVRNSGFRMAGWFPVDGGPLSDLELAVLGMSPYFDVAATMSTHVHDLVAWSLKLRGHSPSLEEIQKRLHIIPHGVDLGLYSIPTKEERADAKQALGIDPDRLVILQMERNQQRKQNYLGLEVMEKLLARKPELRGKLLLYQHMFPDEDSSGCQLGFNLPELAWRYGLRPNVDVSWMQGWIPEGDLVKRVYAAADAFLSTSTGEGFQYPVWEALACGIHVVAPNDSARAAWLSNAPNVTLYDTAKQALVMRGSYNRRMNFPDAGSAAAALYKLLVKKGGTTKGKAEAGRKFVEKTAAVAKVQERWVFLMDQQKAQLMNDRRENKVALPGDSRPDFLVTMEHNPGLGDLVLAAPALVALRKRGKLRLRVSHAHLALAQLLDLADEFETGPTVTVPESSPAHGFHIHNLYWPKHREGWSQPRTHRTEVIARYLGVEVSELVPFTAQLQPNAQKQIHAKFLEMFGVDLASCIAIAFESANPHRALPRPYIHEVANHIKGMGAVPLVLGRAALHIRTDGIIDVTGQTDLMALLGMLEGAGAAVCTDSASLHFAAMFGTPVVGCFALFDPEARLRYYAGPTAAVTPDVEEVDGESWPPGPSPKAAPGEWSRHITPHAIAAALRQLTGVEDKSVRIIRPSESDRAKIGV